MSVTLSVKDFGPLEDATVSLRPFTVFIGANNTGKSYLAMLTYAANHRVPRPSRRYLGLGPTGGLYFDVPGELEFGSDARKFMETWLSDRVFEQGSLTEAAVKSLDSILSRWLESYGASVSDEIERCFSRELQELVRINASSRNSWVELSHGSPPWTLRIHMDGAGSKVDLRNRPPSRDLLRRGLQRIAGMMRQSRLGEMTFSDPARGFGGLRRSVADDIWEDLAQQAFMSCFSEFFPAYYLPAARSGILQSHRLLASLIVSRASLAGIEDMQLGKLTGVLTDFISRLLLMGARRKSGCAGIADYLESDVLKGEVLMTGSRPAYPEIIYRTAEGRFPLQSTSSMVSELAPVVLFLRYLLDPGEILIIEEPESHLHPALQRKFARALVRLSNIGVTVAMTTHSDYFLTEINNLIMAGGLSPEDRVRTGVADEEALNASRVSAYLFSQPPGAGGTKVRRMRVTRSRGISQAEFSKVAEELYSETVALERTLVVSK